MGLFGFKKRRSDVIDFTDRGKNIPEIKTDYGITKDGFIEFKGNTKPDSSKVNSSSGASETSGFDFLNDMAAGSVNNTSQMPSSFSDSGFDPEIKKQLRNVSSMAEQTSNEMYRLLQRIELLERKIDRLEGKS